MENLCTAIRSCDLNELSGQEQTISSLQTYLKNLHEDNCFTEDAASCLTAVVKGNSLLDTKKLCMQCVAELCKEESNRILFVNAGTISVLLGVLSESDNGALVQCFRAIGNICMENIEGQHAVLNSGMLKNVLDKIDGLSKAPFSLPDELPRVAFGCMSNIACENEAIQAEVIQLGAVSILTSCILKFHKKDPRLSVMAINGLAGLTEYESGQKAIAEDKVAQDLCCVLKDSEDNTLIESLLELLCDHSKTEPMKAALCKAGCVEILVEFVQKYVSGQLSSDLNVKQAADLAVLLTSGEESFNALAPSSNSLIEQFVSWLKIPNKHLQISGGLAIGNFARSEEMCSKLVTLDVHTPLINALQLFMDNEEEIEQVHAICGCLKNMSIPAASKPILIDAGLADSMVTLVKTSIAPVQYKGLAILRLLVCDQELLASSLGNDAELIEKIAELAAKQDIAGLCAEAARLTAALVKNCHSSVTMQNIAEHNGAIGLASLLSSEHLVMQNEGLVALVIMASAYPDSLQQIAESEAVERICKLCSSATAQVQVIFNAISFFQSLGSSEHGKKILLQYDIGGVLQSLSTHASDSVRSRSKDTLAALQS